MFVAQPLEKPMGLLETYKLSEMLKICPEAIVLPQVAGNNGTVSLFQVDGKENPKIQTINFQVVASPRHHHQLAEWIRINA